MEIRSQINHLISLLTSLIKNLSQTMAENKLSALAILLWNAHGITNNTEELKLVQAEKT